jgi:hypothetical protein
LNIGAAGPYDGRQAGHSLSLSSGDARAGALRALLAR